MKWFLFRPTSIRVYINCSTLGLVIFLPVTETNWELFSRGDIFKPTLYSKKKKQRALRHAGLSLSSVTSAGALHKQDFPSQKNTLWAKLIESSPSPWWWQRCFLTGNLQPGCFARTATKLFTACCCNLSGTGGFLLRTGGFHTLLLPSSQCRTTHSGLFHLRELKKLRSCQRVYTVSD